MELFTYTMHDNTIGKLSFEVQLDISLIDEQHHFPSAEAKFSRSSQKVADRYEASVHHHFKIEIDCRARHDETFERMRWMNFPV